jgi:hypothetical protein
LKILQGAHRIGIYTWQQAEIIQNHENANVRNMDKANRDTGNIRSLNLAAVKHTTVQVNRMLL